MADGGNSIGRTEHLVLDLPSFSVSKLLLSQRLHESFSHHHFYRLYFLLHHMGCNSLLPLSKYLSLVFSNVGRRNRNTRQSIFLGASFHSGTSCPLCAQFKMDIRLIQAHRQTLDGDRTKNGVSSERVVDNRTTPIQI